MTTPAFMPVYTRDSLKKLSTPELLALYNRLAGKTTTRFASRTAGEEQTWRAVQEAGLNKRMPAQELQARAAKAPSLVNRLIEVMRDGKSRHLDELATTLDATPGQIRGALGGARAQGWQTLNVAPGSFALGDNLGVPQCAGPRYISKECE